MSVRIRLQRPRNPVGSRRSNPPKATRRKSRSGSTGNVPNRKHTERFDKTVKTLFFLFFLSIPFVTLLQTVFAKTAKTMEEYAFARQVLPETVLSGSHWTYSVPFEVQNKAEIEKLIECESAGLNVSGPDSDGLISDGILQFHRGPADTLTRSTWEDFSKASGIAGSPMNPTDAIRMADWAISHGYGSRWTCWRLQKLSP
jgi:hypothetical protein